MSMLPTNRKAEADRSSLENPTHTYNVTTAPTHNLSGRDSVRQPDRTISSLTDTLGAAEGSQVASQNYIYYRIYAEDGAIPSKTPVTPSDPFLGRIKARSVPPPRTARDVKRSIAKVENIDHDHTTTGLFLTSYKESPMDNAVKFTILNGNGPGSSPQEPLALVAKMSDSERSALESDGRGGLASLSAEPDTTSPEIRYVYYLLYVDGYEIPSKVAFDPEEPCLGRIRVDSVTPPHSPTSILRCISRVERNPALAHADLFADSSCDTPLKEGHISILRTNGPGLSPNEPMAIVQMTIVEAVEANVEDPSIPDGQYLIKNRAADIYWNARNKLITTVYFGSTTMEYAKNNICMHWDITQDTNGHIAMASPYAPSSWVGAKVTGSGVPVPWRLIPADSKSYYLTTDINCVSQNPQVPTAHFEEVKRGGWGEMATLEEGNQWQMWEFIRI